MTGADRRSWRERRKQRVSRWDRPPEPRDWRFFVGHLGRVFIATGLLLFGFVAYQLWGTGIETARAQARLEKEFEAALEQNLAPDTAPVPTTIAPATTISGTEPTATTPATAAPPTTAAENTEKTRRQAVTVTEPVVPGDGLYLLEIPDIDYSGVVVAGVDRASLEDGPGFFPDSAQPGQLGKAAIAGHRTTWGGPFYHVDDLEVGARIYVTRRDGNRYSYAVTGQEVVNPEDYHVVLTDNPDVAALTLATCTLPSAQQRLAVHAELIPEESAVVEPTQRIEFVDGDEGDDEGEDRGDDDRVAATGAGATEPPGTPAPTLPGETPASTVPAADAPATTATTVTTEPVAAGEPSDHVEDAFVGGWFADRAAWPQVALWGAIVSLIAVLNYLISRRFRNYAIGITVCIVPFLVGLYFFYQNVNRLLPAGL